MNRTTSTEPPTRSLFSYPLIRELAVVLLVKLLLLTALWFAFFRPPNTAEPVGADEVARAIVGQSK